ncbi:MAG: peptidoglycan DD-metalloendopeptidase family protein [Saprospiraceae bacterium]|nr:peptidoglycan DD-metalloendopeptidase family protein [Saprospiraceae bacterium]
MMFHNIFEAQFELSDFAPIALSISHSDLIGFDVTTFEGLDFYVRDFLQKNKVRVAYGGYGEKRAIYTQSHHFTNLEAVRNTHLGIDLWASAGTRIFAPLEGIVHSFRHNDQPLDYGATIILEHLIEGEKMYALYGHLSLKSLENKQIGQKILRGSPFAWLGEPHENGGLVAAFTLSVDSRFDGLGGRFSGCCFGK